MTPQVICDLRAADRIRERFAAEGKTAVCFGMGNGLDDVKSVSNVEKNIVVSPAALEAAKYLERTYGTPYETGYPLVDEHKKKNKNTIKIIMGKRYLLYSSR